MSTLLKVTAAAFLALQLMATPLALAQDDHAGHDHGAAADVEVEHHANPLSGEWGRALGDKMTLGAFLNFGLMMCIIIYFGRKPISEFLTARRDRISADYTDAQKLKEDAQAAHKEHSERLSKLDSEKKDLHQTMIKAGAAEKERIVAEAKEKAQRLSKDTDFVAEQRRKQLRGDLSADSIQSAVKAAEALLVAKTTEADQVRLAEDFLKQLERDAKRPASASSAPEARA